MLTNSSNTDNTLSTLFDTIWNSLDDILACVGVFLASRMVASTLHWCALSYFNLSPYSAQVIHFVFIGAMLLFLISHLIGSSTAVSLFSGFSIGFGYAMQPYIISILAGATFRSTGMFPAKCDIRIHDKIYTLDHIGMLYVCVVSKDGFITYFPNSTLSESAVGVKS